MRPVRRPPLELLFVELHEEAPVARSVSDLGATIRKGMEREKSSWEGGKAGQNEDTDTVLTLYLCYHAYHQAYGSHIPIATVF